MYNILAIIFKYLFIIIIYLFIFNIIRLIYLDIKGISYDIDTLKAYLKLINKKDSLPYKLKDYYSIEDSLNFGRKNDNDIIIKDPYISKHHYKIVEDDKNYFLEDLDSSNGTYLNNDLVQDVVKLKHGDIIKTGQIEFLFVNRE